MRVVLSTYGSRGDVEPMAALAVRLQALGAQVRVCAPPDEEVTGLLARVGVPMVPFERPWRSWERPTTPREQAERVAEFIAAQYDTLAGAAGDCDVLVATGMSHLVAGSAAEKAGVPHRFVVFSPSVLGASGRAALVGAPIDVPINAHRASIGLPPVHDVFEFMFGKRPWLAADPTLGPLQQTAGADLDVVHTGAWILPDERPLPDELLAFLDAGTPPVYVGFGSMRRVPQDLARVAVEAIRAQGRRVLVGRGWADLTPVDDRVDSFAVGEVNQQRLFARVAAVVHHGGAGTTTAAARAGAPQVVVPQAADQPYWAGRVAELGIGAAYDGPSPSAKTLSATATSAKTASAIALSTESPSAVALSAESLSAALSTALSPETRARAAVVAGAIRTDGAAVAAKLLLDSVSLERAHASA